MKTSRIISLLALLATIAGAASVPVTLDTFIRAETDVYMARLGKSGLGKFIPRREPADIDHQDVVRMNRDTLYTSAVFDLDAAPVTITLPDPSKRFMSMQVINEDHFTIEVAYKPGRYTFTREKAKTRYLFVLVRLLINPEDPADQKIVNALQDAIKVEQSKTGTWEVPDWDPVSQAKIRDALSVLGSMRGDAEREMFGNEKDVDPVLHLIGTAIGWGGNPRRDAIYTSVYPEKDDGKAVYRLTVKDVPVDGFWSISVYDGKGFFEKNEFDLYSLNNFTAKPDADGAITVQFGGDRKASTNWLPIMPGWNYTVRLYRPRKEILEGDWKFPQARLVR
jgi:para-nitrobenzyl esterase